MAAATPTMALKARNRRTGKTSRRSKGIPNATERGMTHVLPAADVALG
jgi:hypothetical protein